MPTFLHAADLHLDSPLRGLDRKEGAPSQRIRMASRRAFERMVDLAIEQRVAFVLLAGDLYDTRPAFETYLFFHQQVDRLSRAGIPIAIVLGNHDHAGASPRAGRLPDRVHVLPADRPASHEIAPGVWVHGQSYPTRDIGDDLSAGYPPSVPSALNIGLLHTALDGYSGEHARYAPSSRERLSQHGYQYWALGHVHTPMVLEERNCRIVYPGNLQGRHARELGPRGVMLVEYEGASIGKVQHIDLDDVRWHRIEIDPAKLDRNDDPLRSVVERIRSETDPCRTRGRLAAVRLCIAGNAPHELLALGETEIRQSLQAMCSGDEALFLEKIELGLRPEVRDRQEVDNHLDALVKEMSELREVQDALSAARRDDLDDLRKAGGPDLLEAFLSRLATPDAIAELEASLPRVREALVSRARSTR